MKLGDKDFNKTKKFFETLGKLNPKELDEKFVINDSSDLYQLIDFLEYQKERDKEFRKVPEVNKNTNLILQLLKDLKEDGKLDLSLDTFGKSTIKSIQDMQTRDKIGSKFEEWEKITDIQKSLHLMCDIYALIYEQIGTYNLKEIAEAIKGESIVEKGYMIRIISEYRNEKYKSLFSPLKPQIRNSIDHVDYLIDNREPFITFFDRDKDPLKLSLNDFQNYIFDILFLSFSFIVAEDEFMKPFNDDVIEKLKKVKDFEENSDFKLILNGKGKLSVYEIGKLLDESDKKK